MTNLIRAYTQPDSYAIAIPIEQIVSDENIDSEYAQSLVEVDVTKFKPIIVIKHPHKDLYAVLDGHHRFEAAKLRHQKTIKAVVVDDYTGLGFDLTKQGVFQPSAEFTKYIRVPLKRFSEDMHRFLFEDEKKEG